MTRDIASSGIQRYQRRQSRPKDLGKRRQGVRKAEVKGPLRRSARLNPELCNRIEQQQSLPINKTLSNRASSAASQARGQKRRRFESLCEAIPNFPIQKRPPTTQGSAFEKQACQTGSLCGSEPFVGAIDYWSKTHTWPKQYFEPLIMNHLLARKKSTASLLRKRSMTSDASATPSDQKTREEKSAPYRNPVYRIQLEKKNSYMNRYVGENEADVTETSKKLCQTLLQTKQTVPEDSMFADEFFQDTCEMLRDRNESKVIQDITRLIVPSAQSLAIRAIRGGSKNLKYLIESVNEGWNNSIPLIGRRPQPDYAVGLKRTAFTEEQLAKIEPIIGDIVTEMSLFMATYYMYFPFLTCEVKSGAAALDIADRQNAHSMTLAVRAIVELFRLGKREKEVHREIMAFSISHDHRTVRIYGHYPVIDGKRTIYYRHPIREFNFIELDSKDKWTAYKFTKNIYEVWMPEHLARIRSVLDELPSDINFEARPHSEATGLSQRFEGSHIARPLTEPGSLLGQSDTQPRIADQVATPSTSLTTPATSKRPKNNARAQT